MKWFVSLLFVFAVNVCFAERVYIDTHNEQHVAQQTAMEYLRKEIGCKWTKTVRTEGFKVYSDGDKAIVVGNELEVRCVEYPEVVKSGYLITWVPPNSRTDGTILKNSDIKGYNIYINGVFYKIVVGNSYLIQDSSLVDEVGIQTVDTFGNVSTIAKAV